MPCELVTCARMRHQPHHADTHFAAKGETMDCVFPKPSVTVRSCWQCEDVQPEPLTPEQYEPIRQALYEEPRYGSYQAALTALGEAFAAHGLKIVPVESPEASIQP